MAIKQTKEEKYEALAREWSNSSSLEDACIRAGHPLKDARGRLRFRRAAERYIGYELPPLNLSLIHI